MLKFEHNTGGRERYFKRHPSGDCVVRAITIALKQDYLVTWTALCDLARDQGLYPNNKPVWQTYLTQQGWEQQKLTKPYPVLDEFEIDLALMTVRAGYGSHLVAVENNTVKDTWDSRYQKTMSFWYPKSAIK